MYQKTLLLTLLSFELTYAALPPRYQNMKDLNVMVKYIENHQKVLTRLESIDFRTYTIYYSGQCKIVFTRPSRFHLPGWVGPATPLEFKSDSCNDIKF